MSLHSRNWGQVDVTLHGWQWFYLAPCPAPLSLPKTTRGADAKPAIATSFANDPFVVINVGYASYCSHAGLDDLWAITETLRCSSLARTGFTVSEISVGWKNPFRALQPKDNSNLTWICCLEGSWTMTVPFTLRSNTPLVPTWTNMMTQWLLDQK